MFQIEIVKRGDEVIEKYPFDPGYPTFFCSWEQWASIPQNAKHVWFCAEPFWPDRPREHPECSWIVEVIRSPESATIRGKAWKFIDSLGEDHWCHFGLRDFLNRVYAHSGMERIEVWFEYEVKE